MSHGADGGAFWLLVLSWWAMMVVMMVPVTWPWLRTLARLTQGKGQGASAVPFRVFGSFLAGYLLVWLGFSVGAAGIQISLAPGGSMAPVAQAGILMAAGLYQLTPAKDACLKHCRSPMSVLLSRWPLEGLQVGRMGVEHGLFCLGCCWALMLLGVGAGTAGWLWMAGLVVLVAAEKLAPSGPRIGRVVGWGLVGGALATFWVP